MQLHVSRLFVSLCVYVVVIPHALLKDDTSAHEDQATEETATLCDDGKVKQYSLCPNNKLVGIILSNILLGLHNVLSLYE